ncbi:MAG TPA: Maf family nucleotide pyrophosphatase [Dyadobacter sp.]|jgi:septum formation protein|nr:Maf family nucleotide pyrophosphatase [Dyadobacter sp.]
MFKLNTPLILASNSPRRKQLLHDAGFDFEVEVRPTDETFPASTAPLQVARYISEQKAEVFRDGANGKLILTADTVVLLGDTILGKPANREEAYVMLRSLSGNTHQVVTAVSLLANGQLTTYSDIATVSFKTLEDFEINYYLDQYKPFDKAGSYGIQEWIGMIGIDSIQGSFYTIMGLPVHIVYHILKPYMSIPSTCN